VSESELERANGMLARYRTASWMAGPALGGALASVSAASVLGLAALLALGGAIAAATLPAIPPAREPASDTRGGLRLLLSQPALRTLTTAWLIVRIGFAVELTAAVPLGHEEGPKHSASGC